MAAATARETMQAYWSGHTEGTLAEDACFVDMATGEEARGRESIEQMVDYLYHHAFDAAFEPSTAFFGDNVAVVEGYFAGTHTGEFAGIEPTGLMVRVPICIVYELAEGLIRRARIYHMTDALIEALDR